MQELTILNTIQNISIDSVVDHENIQVIASTTDNCNFDWM